LFSPLNFYKLNEQPFYKKVAQTLLFGCANPTFWLPKPCFSVVLTLLFIPFN